MNLNNIKIAKNVLETNMGLRAGEKLVIITDTEMCQSSDIFFTAAAFFDVDPLILTMNPRQYRGQEPPEIVAVAMKEADVALLLTNMSLSHTYARLNATKSGTRIASMGCVSPDMFIHGLNEDYYKVMKRAEIVSKFLSEGKNVKVKTERGTDVVFSIEGREAPYPDNGIYNKSGLWGNLPAGEAFIAPLEDSISGKIVADITISPLGRLYENVTLNLKDGKINEIIGGKQADELIEFLHDIDDENAYRIAELGIGMNSKTKICGKMIEDEKKLGTLHFGFGMNIDFGGKNESKTHYDVLISKPTLQIDDKTIISKGRYKIEL